MPSKTICVRNEDVELWRKAEEMAGDSLSGLIAEALGRFVREKELAQLGAKRLEVDTKNGRKAFIGKWFIHLGEEYSSESAAVMISTHYAVALTKNGNIAVYIWDWINRESGQLLVYESFEEAKEDGIPEDVLALASQRIGGNYVQELDI